MQERGSLTSGSFLLWQMIGQGWLRLTSYAKVAVGWPFMLMAFAIFIVVLIVLLPSRLARIKACNHFGTVVGHFYIWLLGCPLTITGRERLDGSRPAIYVSNHSSVLDIFLAIWLSPTGTVGTAKKQILYYPFFGILYLLSGHLRVDRGNTKKAIGAMDEVAELIKRHKLSLFIWPEGTRSRTGRLLPLKKGFANMAIKTGLPVVPFVVSGAQKCWEAKTHLIRPVPIHVDVLEPIDTSHWSAERLDEALEEVHAAFRKALPPDQKPLAS